MTDHSHIAMSFEANNVVGPLDCSAGGVPYNSGHIEYWKGQAREARAEITKLRAERAAAARDMRERCAKAADELAAYEQVIIDRTHADTVLSEEGQCSIVYPAGSRQVAAQFIARAIRALPDTPALPSHDGASK